MRVAIASKFWPESSGNNGMSLMSRVHVEVVRELGHDVWVICEEGSLESSHEVIEVATRGNGSLHSPIKRDLGQIERALKERNLDLIMVENFQTGISESVITANRDLNIPLVMISHGVNLTLINFSLRRILHWLSWLPYRNFVFPKLFGHISYFMALNNGYQHERFLDSVRWLSYDDRIFPFVNTPVHHTLPFKTKVDRRPVICSIGYFSDIKNQCQLLRILKKIDYLDLKLVIVSPPGYQNEPYYKKFENLVAKYGCEKQVEVLRDDEVSVSEVIGTSLCLVSTSLTETQSIVLLEAMAHGTPFVARPVGLIPTYQGGFFAKNDGEFSFHLGRLIDDDSLWESVSYSGRRYQQLYHTRGHLKSCFLEVFNQIRREARK